jgi:hypothetical protein
MFNTFYMWISAHHSFLVSSFADFLTFVHFFFFSSRLRGSLVCSDCVTLHLLILNYFKNKKKKNS